MFVKAIPKNIDVISIIFLNFRNIKILGTEKDYVNCECVNKCYPRWVHNAWITLIFADKSGVNCVDKYVDRVDINTAVTLL